ncbi:MAG: type IV secretory system conjugative DNA transfer family protein [Pseudomonadota bacterium]
MRNLGLQQKILFISLFFGTLVITTVFFIAACIVGVSVGWEYVTYDLNLLNNALQQWIFLIKNFDKITYDYYNYYPIKVALSTFIPIFFIAFVIFVFRAPLLDFRPFEKKESIHGDARWATQSDIKKAGLREKKGMLLGVDRHGYFIAGGYQHTLLFAPTGSGKGVGFVIPNLLFWHDSVVVHDIKLENWELTSGYRKKKLKQDVYLWNPASADGISHCYNPLDWVSHKMGQQVDDVQKISNLLLPEQEFWQNEARSLCVGVMLYLLAVPERPTTFGEVVRVLRSDDVVYNLAVVLDTIGGVIHPVAYMNIAAFLQKADKERSGVISTLNSSLELWANPLIDATTARSDFNFNQIKKSKTTIFVGLTPDNIERLKPLMQIFYQQATQFLCKHMPKKDEPFGVMFMLDEFPTLGDMEQFKTGIAYFRGYKVRLFLIIQDTEQLKGIYEDSGMNSFLSNSTYRVTFAANNVETSELISKMVGNKTVKQFSLNKPKFLDLNPGSRSLHQSETQRALLLPQEVINLPRDEQILLIESSPPIKSKKIFYYKDSFFTRRLFPPTHVPEQEPYDPRKHAPGSAAQQPPPVEDQEQPQDNLPLDDLPSLPPVPDDDEQNTETSNDDIFDNSNEFEDEDGDIVSEYHDYYHSSDNVDPTGGTGEFLADDNIFDDDDDDDDIFVDNIEDTGDINHQEYRPEDEQEPLEDEAEEESDEAYFDEKQIIDDYGLDDFGAEDEPNSKYESDNYINDIDLDDFDNDANISKDNTSYFEDNAKENIDNSAGYEEFSEDDYYEEYSENVNESVVSNSDSELTDSNNEAIFYDNKLDNNDVANGGDNDDNNNNDDDSVSLVDESSDKKLTHNELDEKLSDNDSNDDFVISDENDTGYLYNFDEDFDDNFDDEIQGDDDTDNINNIADIDSKKNVVESSDKAENGHVQNNNSFHNSNLSSKLSYNIHSNSGKAPVNKYKVSYDMHNSINGEVHNQKNDVQINKKDDNTEDNSLDLDFDLEFFEPDSLEDFDLVDGDKNK